MSSLPQSHSAQSAPSLDIARPSFTPSVSSTAPGSLNDEHVIRGLITSAIKSCSKSRQEIADEMTTLLGSQVTKRALDSFTSEAADQNRFPLQYSRAFCQATGDWELVRCVAERSGLHVISPAEHRLLELGRQILIQDRSATAIATLKQQLTEARL